MRIFVPSYVIPGTYGQNVRVISRIREIEGVEILFFSFDARTEELFRQEKSLIERYAGRFSYSAHMPDPLDAGHERIIELTGPLAERYILHPPESDPELFLDTVRRWRRRYGERFLLENVRGRDFDGCLEALDRMPVCMDTGSLLLGSGDIPGFLETYGPRLAEIHLHGVEEGRDHRPFEPREAWFGDLIPFLRGFGGAVNVELFSIEEVRVALRRLAAVGLVPRRRSGQGPRS